VPLSSQTSCGVFSENESDDIHFLVENFTSPALATSLRDREETLHICADLIMNEDYDSLREILQPFLKRNVVNRRKKHSFSVTKPLEPATLSFLQRHLQRIPRQVFRAAGKRASVIIPLCNANGIPSILLERRSETVRTHKLEVCLSMSVSPDQCLSLFASFPMSLSPSPCGSVSLSVGLFPRRDGGQSGPKHYRNKFA
jgi:hypothetical protein